ncbi:MAG: hypothetical protein ACJ71M_12770 [Nitrososphaeraceae archaeon]
MQDIISLLTLMATSENAFDLQQSLAVYSNLSLSTANPWIKLGLSSAEHFRQYETTV